ncbi:MAG: S26 family signal peptidase, partial [Planctomycetota bacterium]
VGAGKSRRRMGDRILVLKCLYPFSRPERFDVVVFKNPTDPDGDSANYIKRLVGLPDEKVWLLDGDVFAAENREDVELDEYRIQRKPEHVQRAVWQPVQRSDFVPTKPDRLFPPFMGPPWRGEPGAWNITGRVYECLTAEPTQLRWDNERRELDDWSVYNASSGRSGDVRPVADIRVAAGVQADSARDLRSTFEIEVRDHTIQFLIDGGGGE